jgi:2-keto-4-pentenoate hydratase/2-oxohepta-3-ene-1,7-dioic acid hydratase in catechol pathway
MGVKLATFWANGETRLGVIQGDQVVDLAAAAAAASGGLESITGVGLKAFASMEAFLAGGPDTVRQAAAFLRHWPEGRPLPFSRPLPEVRWAVPLANPGKIICIGLNYADHCREQNVAVPERPIVFTKFNTALLPHEGTISWPAGSSEQVDYEAELAVVIGREARQVSEVEAMDYVWGYTILNDISARDVQFGDGQWIRGKSFDTFCPCGPVVVTAETIPDPHDLAIRCRVNGATLQDSNTGEMIFRIPYLISYISRTCTLRPGDIISTGTPNGVGVFRDPKVFLRPGDVVEVEVAGIGVLRNRVG